MIKQSLAAIVLTAVILFSGCGSNPAATSTPQPATVTAKPTTPASPAATAKPTTPAPAATPKPATAVPTTPAPAQPAWQSQWDKTVAAAKQEGKVVLFTTVVADTKNDLTNAFTRAYGIQPEYMTMSGAEFATKLLSERRAGVYSTDLFNGGITTLYTQVKPAGALDSLKDGLILPEVTDVSKWYGQRLPFVDKENMICAFAASAGSYINVNTTIVKPGEVKGYADLLNPKWKGQIVINDPTIAGRGLDWFQVMDKLMGPDFVPKLLAQEPVVTRDRRLQVEWVARGKYGIGLALDTSSAQEFIKSGAPLSVVWPVEGPQLSTEKGGLALINQAPHPNAARVYANWMLSREAQTLWSKDELLQSAREDVPSDFLPPEQVRDPKKKYVYMETDEWYSTKDKYKDMATKLFADLIAK